MVFHFRNPSGAPPTASDCRNVADAYGLWENDGFLLGYYLLRGIESGFKRANAFGIDPASRASFIDAPFTRPGFIPDEPFLLTPAAVSPLVRWSTSERGANTGRTYVCGGTNLASDPDPDESNVTGAYGAILQSTFDVLRTQVQALTGFIQVHYTTSPRGGLGPGSHLLDITGCSVSQLMATQRRRMRP